MKNIFKILNSNWMLIPGVIIVAIIIILNQIHH